MGQTREADSLARRAQPVLGSVIMTIGDPSLRTHALT